MPSNDPKWREAVSTARTHNRHREERLGNQCLPSRPCDECRELALLIRMQLQPLEKEIATATGGIGKGWLDAPAPENSAQPRPAAPDVDPISPAQVAEAERLSSKAYLSWNQPQPDQAADTMGLSEVPIVIKLTRLLILGLRFRDAKLSELRQAVGLMTTALPSMVMDAEHPIEMAQQVVAECDRLRDKLIQSATVIGRYMIRDKPPSLEAAVDQAYRDCAAAVSGLCASECSAAAIRRARPQAFESQGPKSSGSHSEGQDTPDDPPLEELEQRVSVLEGNLEERIQIERDDAANQAYRDCAALVCEKCAKHVSVDYAGYHRWLRGAILCEAHALRRHRPQAFADQKPAPAPEAPEVVIPARAQRCRPGDAPALYSGGP